MACTAGIRQRRAQLAAALTVRGCSALLVLDALPRKNYASRSAQVQMQATHDHTRFIESTAFKSRPPAVYMTTLWYLKLAGTCLVVL